MNKFEIGDFLGKGFDVCVFDSRGTLNSRGYPSEAGLYNDIDAVGEYLTSKYNPREICIYGSCGESFTAMHLFKKFYAEGMNMILVNSPASLDRVLSRVNSIAQKIFRFNAQYIKAPIGSISAKDVIEDNFDSLEKLQHIKPCKNPGYVILAVTEGDKLATLEDTSDLAGGLKKLGNNVVVLKSQAKDFFAKKGLSDPHLAYPLRNPILQDKMLETMHK